MAEPLEQIYTDGACGLSWDDSIITSMTPTPSARCPFEYFHEYEDGECIPLSMDDIPTYHIVRPTAEGGEEPRIAKPRMEIVIKYVDGFGGWGWYLSLDGEDFDSPYASLDTALDMARLEARFLEGANT